MYVLVAGWPSFLDGEATAGDVLSMDAVGGALERARIPHETAWSPRFRPGRLHLDDAPPERYTHLVFVCGPLSGEPVRELHRRYARCRRIAVGVSVIDPGDPAARGFDTVLPRDGVGPARRDLSAWPQPGTVPVVGAVLTSGQAEYGRRGLHEPVEAGLTAWLARQDCARVALDTRLDVGDWRQCATAAQFTSALARMDVVVTMRLHGLVLALRAGVPALAVDPVSGGGKVTAQAGAWSWPAVVAGDAIDVGAGHAELDRWYQWCRGPAGRAAARQHRRPGGADPPASLADDLLHALRAG